MGYHDSRDQVARDTPLGDGLGEPPLKVLDGVEDRCVAAEGSQCLKAVPALSQIALGKGRFGTPEQLAWVQGDLALGTRADGEEAPLDAARDELGDVEWGKTAGERNPLDVPVAIYFGEDVDLLRRELAVGCLVRPSWDDFHVAEDADQNLLALASPQPLGDERRERHPERQRSLHGKDVLGEALARDRHDEEIEQDFLSLNRQDAVEGLGIDGPHPLEHSAERGAQPLVEVECLAELLLADEAPADSDVAELLAWARRGDSSKEAIEHEELLHDVPGADVDGSGGAPLRDVRQELLDGEIREGHGSGSVAHQCRNLLLSLYGGASIGCSWLPRALEEVEDMALEDHKIALFIDFENIALGLRDTQHKTFEVTLVLARLLEKGKVVVRRAYADWDRYLSYKRPFHEAAIELIDIPLKKYSGKNSADIRMVVDALDLCYAKGHVTTFALGTGDSDFSPLVSKLRENDKYVMGFGVKNSSSELLISNCDEFVYYEDLVRAQLATVPLEGLPKKKQECFTLLIDAIKASMRDGKEVLWGSMVKQTMQRKRPEFNEEYFEYSTFSKLLEDAEKHKIIKLRRDQRSGTYVVAGFDVGSGESAEVAREDAAGSQAGGVVAQVGPQQSKKRAPARRRHRSPSRKSGEG